MEDKKWNEFSVTRIASIDKNRETAYAMIDRWERERERKNGKGEERRGERSADIHRGFLDRRVLSFPGDRPTIAQQRFSPRLFAHRMDGRVFTVDKIATHRATAHCCVHAFPSGRRRLAEQQAFKPRCGEWNGARNSSSPDNGSIHPLITWDGAQVW